MSVLIVLGSLVGAIFVSIRFSGGVLIGGILAVANYFWQRHSTSSLFERVLAGQPAAMPGLRFILRYVLIGLVVAFFYVTDALPILAVVLGLAAFSFAVVFEGLIGIFSSSIGRDD